MFELTRTMYTETAHLLKDHSGKCQYIHGHSYKWSVTICALSLNSNDMVMDFSDLKRIMDLHIGPYDHALAVDMSSYSAMTMPCDTTRVLLFRGRPTAEVMAKDVYIKIKSCLPVDVQLAQITCRETKNNEAVYYES